MDNIPSSNSPNILGNSSPKIAEKNNHEIKVIVATYKETLNLNDLSISFFVDFTYSMLVRKIASKNIKNLIVEKISIVSREK